MSTVRESKALTRRPYNVAMPTRIKICGIRRPEHARVAAEAGASAVGLNFVERSPRYVTLDEARAVIDALPPFVEPIGLFVDATTSHVRDTAATLGLRTVQLHGGEEPAYAHELMPLRVIRGVAFNKATFIQTATLWAQTCPNLAGLLIDAPPASADALTGGSGRAFDWAALAETCRRAADSLPPLILAGGLNPENVTAAITAVRPWAVDVSSGVEKSRGLKDARRITAFCAAVRAADATMDSA